MEKFANDTFIVPNDGRIDDIPAGFEPRAFGLQFIPLLRVRINRVDTLLMKPGGAGWSGYNVESVRVPVPAGRDAFLAARDAALAALRSGPGWDAALDRALAAALPGSGFSIRRLLDDLLRDFGMDAARAGNAVRLEPFSEPPHVLYSAWDDAAGVPTLYAAVFLKLVVETDDDSFLEYRNLEYVPIGFFSPALRLHPRYALHTAVIALFRKYGLPVAGSVCDEIPVHVWNMRRRQADAITFACDLSYYYDNVGDPQLFERGFFPPNPESREERFLADLRALVDEGLRPDLFGPRALALLDGYAIEALVRSGMFFRSYSPGMFAGIVETSDLDDGEGRSSLSPFHAFADLARFFRRVRVVIDRKRIDAVGPLYDDPERWFNLRRDIVPFDAERELARAGSLLERAPVPAASGAADTGFRRYGLVLTEAAASYVDLSGILTGEDGRPATAVEPGSLYVASRDDALYCYRAGGETFIWRKA